MFRKTHPRRAKIGRRLGVGRIHNCRKGRFARAINTPSATRTFSGLAPPWGATLSHTPRGYSAGSLGIFAAGTDGGIGPSQAVYSPSAAARSSPGRD